MNLVSIILPVFNGAQFLNNSIQSVMKQDHTNWELLVINDGSTDDSKQIIGQYQDSRIKYFEQVNKGVSSARNVGLAKMTGDYFCFLDADDLLSPNSLSARLAVFEKNPIISFVDGKVFFIDSYGTRISGKYLPNYTGDPFSKLLALSSDCFFGSTWMIKKRDDVSYRFDENMTHSEDLNFYLSFAKEGYYDFTKEWILSVRMGNESAMSNLIGLENGYIQLIKNIRNNFPDHYRLSLKLRVLKIMFLSHLFDGKDPINALGSIYRILRT
ncbi:glycosyltransferase family 2 protein [Reichenbachiella sp.]|uniref:glycosyltransferase family 2 protein n=1 Tax=Reichenbachiella sp. TaxID=2184521 RepID=UPI003BAE8701